MARPPVRPIVILGAARSGTKILRDTLAEAMGVGMVPYDVGYVWRYGNESRPDDCLAATDVRPRTRRLVRSFLARYADDRGVVVEKTVGNTLRVPFVAEVLPEADFVHVVRNGVDVAMSARREWHKSPDARYLLAKARHFPIRLVPTYGRKFLVGAVASRIGRRGHVNTWGPRYPGIDGDLVREGLLTVSARQWRESVTRASHDLTAVPGRVVQVRYEELVAAPETTLAGIIDQLGQSVDPGPLTRAAARVTARRGREHRMLDHDERAILDEEIGAILEVWGYDTV